MTVPSSVLGAWPWPADVTTTRLQSGLINPTWRVDHDGRPLAILQRLNTGIFQPSVHHDIEAVTAHLTRAGLLTPRLVPTAGGALWHDDGAGGVWRALTVVGTRTLAQVEQPTQARSAGALVARFHAAVADLDWTFQHVRLGVHDTPRHMRVLREAVDTHTAHRLHGEVAPLAASILASWDALSTELPADLPVRVVHGDLKLSNVRFDGDTAVALIDLDTLARDTLGAELGDALRSWCGTAGEDRTDATFDLDVFEAAMTGYASGAGAWGPTTDEWRAVVPSVERIATELAARFAADALNERYFGWDADRFPAAGEHNLVRARGQANLARAVHAARGTAERMLDGIRSRSR